MSGTDDTPAAAGLAWLLDGGVGEAVAAMAATLALAQTSATRLLRDATWAPPRPLAAVTQVAASVEAPRAPVASAMQSRLESRVAAPGPTAPTPPPAVPVAAREPATLITFAPAPMPTTQTTASAALAIAPAWDLRVPQSIGGPPLPQPMEVAPVVQPPASSPVSPLQTATSPAVAAPSATPAAAWAPMLRPQTTAAATPMLADAMPAMAPVSAASQPGAGGLAPPLPSMAPPSQPSGQSGPTGGDVFLDGVRMGRWVADHLARAAGRPQSGSTSFDPSLTPRWPGTLQGG